MFHLIKIKIPKLHLEKIAALINNEKKLYNLNENTNKYQEGGSLYCNYRSEVVLKQKMMQLRCWSLSWNLSKGMKRKAIQTKSENKGRVRMSRWTLKRLFINQFLTQEKRKGKNKENQRKKKVKRGENEKLIKKKVVRNSSFLAINQVGLMIMSYFRIMAEANRTAIISPNAQFTHLSIFVSCLQLAFLFLLKYTSTLFF